MDKNVMRVLGIVALVVCAVCVFVAIERYQTNAKNVRAMNQGPISGAGGVVLLVMSAQTKQTVDMPGDPTG